MKRRDFLALAAALKGLRARAEEAAISGLHVFGALPAPSPIGGPSSRGKFESSDPHIGSTARAMFRPRVGVRGMRRPRV